MAAFVPHRLNADAIACIPADLRNRPQWVAVRLEKRGGDRLEKVPVNPATGSNASVSDPATWGAFAAAVARARQDRLAVGFVLTADSGIVGIDIDHCVHDGEISPEAAAIVGRFIHTYWEVSVSGRGLRGFMEATKPGPRCRTSRHDIDIYTDIEIYDAGRMLTMTGEWVDGTSTMLAPYQQALDDLYREIFPSAPERPAARPVPITSADDHEILRRCRMVPRFEPLYGGDTSAHGGDRSAADLSLCGLFAWAGATEDQVDRLFRSSGLMRDKWDRDDYRARTIDRAMDSTDRWTPGNDFGVSGAATIPTPRNDFGVSGSDDPATTIAALVAKLEAAEQKIVRLETELARRDALDRIAANDSLGAARKGTAEAMGVIVRMVDRRTGEARPNGPDGAYHLNPYTLAERAGMTPRTFRTQLETMASVPLPDDVLHQHDLPEGTPAWTYQERKRPHPTKPGKVVVDVFLTPTIPAADLLEVLGGEEFDAPRPGPVEGRTPVLVEQELVIRQTRRNAASGEAVAARVTRVRDLSGEAIRLPMNATSISVVNEDGELVTGRWESFEPAADDPEFYPAGRVAEMISASPDDDDTDDDTADGDQRDTERGDNFGGVSQARRMFDDDDPGEAGADRWTA